jgi:2-desacetyl-2-hydroxyethyl bacteriochlorophyllide A dehydrogenase
VTQLPATMRAAVYLSPGKLVVRDVPLAPPAPGELVVEVEFCGICGTDLHLVLEGWGKPESIPGHEWSGTVVAVGPDVDAALVGRLVVGGSDPCGTCRHCRAGRPSICENDGVMRTLDVAGAFATHRVCAARTVHLVPDGLDPRTAAIAEPIAVATHGISRGGVRPEHRVLVTGAGPIGLFTVAVLRERGVSDVTVTEPNPRRRERALRAGATTALHPDDHPPGPLLPFDTAADPYDVVLECTGRAEAFTLGLDHLVPGGTIVVVGSGLQPLTVNPARLLLQEPTITGSYEFDADGVPSALRLLASGRLPVDLLLEPDDVGLDDLFAAMQSLARGERDAKLLCRPR